jgi:hypothetical protein
MQESKIPIYIVRVDMLCDCGGRLMKTPDPIPTTWPEAADPPQIRHRCDRCGGEQTLPMAYPHFECER